MIDNQNIKRTVKQKGIKNKFKLYVYIANGFDVGSKHSADSDIETLVEFDIDGKIEKN